MVRLTKQSAESEQTLLIAENDSDYDIIDYFYHSGIVFGAFKLYNYKDDKSKTSSEAKFMMKNYPLGNGFIHINVVNSFANKPKDPELNVTP